MWHVEIYLNDVWVRTIRSFETSDEAFTFAKSRFFDYHTRIWAPAKKIEQVKAK